MVFVIPTFYRYLMTVFFECDGFYKKYNKFIKSIIIFELISHFIKNRYFSMSYKIRPEDVLNYCIQFCHVL